MFVSYRISQQFAKCLELMYKLMPYFQRISDGGSSRSGTLYPMPAAAGDQTNEASWEEWVVAPNMRLLTQTEVNLNIVV